MKSEENNNTSDSTSTNTKSSSTAVLLAEEFKAKEKDSLEIAKERLNDLKYAFPRFSTLSRMEKILIEAGF